MTKLASRLFVMSRRSIVGMALVGLLLPFAAFAQDADLDRLRAEGILAERFDGYVMERQGGDGATRATVDRVNGERRSIYEQRAAEQGVSANEVGQVYAAQIFKKAPAGTYFLNADGSWVQR
ncbi:MAG: YdbL family protein [Dongiaceae bacterium]